MTKPQQYTKEYILQTLDKFRNKAGCSHTEYVSGTLLGALKMVLPYEDYIRLHLGREHFMLGEGPAELYQACKDITEKYK